MTGYLLTVKGKPVAVVNLEANADKLYDRLYQDFGSDVSIAHILVNPKHVDAVDRAHDVYDWL